jgi:predicted MFS family arabinose efflux permease
VPTAIAVLVFGGMMMCNVGRMIPAMAMVTSSVEPRRRGAFLSANSSVQHMACGLGASIGGLIIAESSSGKIEHFGTVGWIAVASTLASLWLAGHLRVADEPVSAEEISLAAAAEGEAVAGEPMLVGEMTK